MDINNLDTDIKFKIEHIGNNVQFLDLDITLFNNKIIYQLYEKDILCIKRYLEIDSNHPKSTSRGIPVGIMKRILTLTPNRLTAHVLFNNIFLSRFIAINHNQHFINKIWWLLVQDKFINSKQRQLVNQNKLISKNLQNEIHYSLLRIRYDPSWLKNKKKLQNINEIIGHNNLGFKPILTVNPSLKHKVVRSRFQFNQKKER